MSVPPVERHVQAAKREVRVRAWSEARTDAAWRELQSRHQATERRRRQLTAIGASVALAAAALLGVVTWRTLTVPSTQTQVLNGAGLQRLDCGEASAVEFAPGVDVSVKERSPERVVVAVASGVARFHVRHDPRRIFRVLAGTLEIEDTGTEFDVDNRGSVVSVTVRQGSVIVTRPGDKTLRAELHAGQQDEYPTAAPSAAIAATEPTASSKEPSAPPAAAPSATKPASDAVAAPDFRQLSAAGDDKGAYELLAQRGFRDVRDEAGDLLLASDVARRSHHAAQAATLLRKLVAGHPKDPRAPSAAFTLGLVLLNELGQPLDAAAAFERAESLAPHGNLAEDALARATESWHRAGNASRAQADLERYRARFPNGRHQAALERLLGAH